MTSPFLTAAWRDLLILNYEVPAEILTSLLPAGTGLDLWEGNALVSLVGFRFLDTRVRGFAIPGHRHFEELNLRFYVTRRTSTGTLRRGVVFVRELVPRAAIAWVARVIYGEPYLAVPMRHSVAPTAVAYEALVDGVWGGVFGSPIGTPAPATDRPQTAFITEHYWGYTRRPPERTDEYEVRHPVWRVQEVTGGRHTLNVATLYGPEFVTPLSRPPVSAFLADGSPVEVHPGTTL